MGKRGKGGGRSRTPGCGRGGNEEGSRSQCCTKKSAPPTPGPNTFARTPRLCLKLGKPRHGTHQPVIGFNQRAEEEEDGEQQSEDDAEPSVRDLSVRVRRTRAGREIKAKNYEGFLVGSEMAQIDSSPVKKVDDYDGEAQYQNFTSSPPGPAIIAVQQPPQPRKRGRLPKKSNIFAPPLRKVDENPSETSSETIAPYSDDRREAFSKLKPDPAVYQIMNFICQSAKVAIELPELSEAKKGDIEKPYSATFLMHLYIVAFDASQWNLCDLVADTWIRTFHALRRRAEKKGNKELELWRPNKQLISRDSEQYNRKAPKYGSKLRTEDPLLEDNVIDFDRELLNLLYRNTAPNCGARLLWADSMALSGTKLEDVMARQKKQGEKWHPDLVYDVMLTSLRMCRRKLTLKIEECTEGAWCKRYHEHGKYGMRCYREMAFMKNAKDSNEDESDALALQIQAEFGRDKQQGYAGVKYSEGDAKHVHFGIEDMEMVDVDPRWDPNNK